MQLEDIEESDKQGDVSALPSRSAGLTPKFVGEAKELVAPTKPEAHEEAKDGESLV